MQKQLIETNRIDTADVEYVFLNDGQEDNHMVSSDELERFCYEQDYCNYSNSWNFLLDQFEYVTEQYWKIWAI